MTNQATGTGLYKVEFGEAIPLTSCLAWLGILLLIIWTLWTVGRWILSRAEQREPTPVVVACITQFALFLLLGTNADLRSTLGTVCMGVPDHSILFLTVAEMLQGVFASCLAGLACTCLACGVARRLPNLSLYAVLPLLIALADTILSVVWLFWMLTLKKC